jgi:porin
LYFECLGKEFDAIEETLSKDWAGFRTELTKLGITPTASYTAQFMGNPSGGHSQGFTYAGTLQAAIAWDLHKLFGIPGLSFNVGASWSSGENLSSKYIGNVFTVQSAFTGSGLVNLDQMYLQQQLFDGVLTLAAGRLAPANTFATLPVFSNYLNDGINTGVGSLGINDSTFTSSPPGVEWGAQAIYNVRPSLQIAVGIFNTNPDAAAGKDHGVNFAFQQGNTGVLTVGQVNYLLNQSPGETGLPGQYSIGGFYDSNSFHSLSNPSSMVSGDYSLYGLFQQMVYRDGGADSQKGLTVWGEAAFSPKPSVSTMPYFVGAGMSYMGLIPGRGQDIASFGVICGTFSGYIPSTSAETVLEVNYQVAVTSWLSVTPDVQYVIKPGGSSGIPNAFVIGAQLAVTF